MYFLTLGMSFVILCVQPSSDGCSTSAIEAIANTQLSKLLSYRTDMQITVKLLPYEILAGKARSYADISLTVANMSENETEVKVSHIEVVASDSKQVLLSSSPEKLGLPTTISLKPKENKALDYRLQSESRVYQRGQDVFARIVYCQNGHEQLSQSNSEAVAFMIP